MSLPAQQNASAASSIARCRGKDEGANSVSQDKKDGADGYIIIVPLMSITSASKQIDDAYAKLSELIGKLESLKKDVALIESKTRQ
jgi:hypothetical protein